MAPGTYSICESMQNGWVQTYPGTQTVPTCHQVTIDATGQAVTGMNFGNQGRGTLTVLKKLVPATDDGKFNLLINNEVKAQNVGNAGTTGAVEVAAGTHSASETAGTDTNLANYNSTFHCWDEGGEFGANGTSLEVNIEPGQNMICEFINTRKQGQVKVVKDVVNDNSGTLTHADFTFTNNGEEFTLESTEDSPSPDGEITLTLPVGTTFSIVEEDADSYEYSTSYSGDCEGMVTEDETPVCTITNDDIPHPGIKVVKSGPENIQAGEVATYTFTVTNTGDIELEIGRVVDDVAGLGIYRSGDTDDDGLLDLNETWVYQASRQLTENGSVTNTVEVCAIDEFETEVCGTDKHTTIVYTPQVLGDVVVKKNPPVLENTGNSLILPILAGLFTTVTAVIVFFDKQRTSLIEAAKRAFKTPFAVPGV